MTVIDRPVIEFDEGKHAYTLDGERVPGVSTVAKIGDDPWGPASWWGFRIGYEGAFDAMIRGGVEVPASMDELRAELIRRGQHPNAKRDKAAARGNATHAVLERLAQNDDLADPSGFPDAERRGHALSLIRWYLHFRPEFEAVEVMVGSREHRFAGRYDIRCLIDPARLGPKYVESLRSDGRWLCLVDLKTSKRVYPAQHFPQLAGYEGASVEMGFPRTAGQFVLNTKPDGSFDPAKQFVRSTATYDDFLAYLAAHRSMKRLSKGE